MTNPDASFVAGPADLPGLREADRRRAAAATRARRAAAHAARPTPVRPRLAAAGTRSFLAVLQPVLHAPGTRGLPGSRTGVLWARDCFASLLTHPVTDGAQLDQAFWAETFLMVHSIFTPWHPLLDAAKFDAHVDRTADLNASTVASAHGPVMHDTMIKEAFELVRQLPTMEPRPMFNQADLEGMLAAMAAGA